VAIRRDETNPDCGTNWVTVKQPFGKKQGLDSPISLIGLGRVVKYLTETGLRPIAVVCSCWENAIDFDW
jgi:hypothetical protein